MTMFDFFDKISLAFNKAFISPIIKSSFKKCGKKVVVGRKCRFHGIKNISIGSDCSVGDDCLFMCTKADIKIGDHVMIAPKVSIITGDHRIDCLEKPMSYLKEKDKLPENDQSVIFAGDNWVGSNAIILKGVTVNKGAVIASGAVVTKDVPEYAVVGGIPARVISWRNKKK